MKRQKTFLASLCLGVFLFAMAAPTLTIDEEVGALGIDKRKLTKRI
ncbi:hypothetical protein [Maribacter sp. 2307ULW6-5]